MCFPKVEEYEIKNTKKGLIKPYISMTIDPNTNIFSIQTNQTKKKLPPKRQQSPKSTGEGREKIENASLIFTSAFLLL
jgi:hypothetical protein